MTSRIPSRPILLLIAMTIATMIGPIVIGLVLRGGETTGWPPDRPFEWAVLIVVTAVFVALMAATIAAGWAEMRKPVGTSGTRGPEHVAGSAETRE